MEDILVVKDGVDPYDIVIGEPGETEGVVGLRAARLVHEWSLLNEICDRHGPCLPPGLPRDGEHLVQQPLETAHPCDIRRERQVCRGVVTAEAHEDRQRGLGALRVTIRSPATSCGAKRAR